MSCLPGHAPSDRADVAGAAAFREVAGPTILLAGAARGVALRVLYVASAIDAGAASGGATHVAEVACGLKALGHEFMTITKSGGDALPCGLPLSTTNLPQQLALASFPRVSRIARAFRPDVVMERFYNFAGAGVLYAHRKGIPSVLEVNAPMVDPPGSMKTRLDKLLLG